MLCCVPLHSIEKILIKTILLVKQIRIYKTRFIFYIIYTKRNTKYHRLDRSIVSVQHWTSSYPTANHSRSSNWPLNKSHGRSHGFLSLFQNRSHVQIIRGKNSTDNKLPVWNPSTARFFWESLQSRTLMALIVPPIALTWPYLLTAVERFLLVQGTRALPDQFPRCFHSDLIRHYRRSW